MITFCKKINFSYKSKWLFIKWLCFKNEFKNIIKIDECYHIKMVSILINLDFSNSSLKSIDFDRDINQKLNDLDNCYQKRARKNLSDFFLNDI